MSDETLLFLIFLSIPVALVMMAATTGASQYESATNRQEETHEEEPKRLPQRHGLREIAGSECDYIDGVYTVQDNQPVLADKRYALEDSRW